MSKETNYFSEALVHPKNMMFVASSVLGSVMLSLPFGLPGIVMGACVAILGEMIMVTAVPNSSLFIAYVDNKKATENREMLREKYATEIKRFTNSRDENWGIYNRMSYLASSIREMAGSNRLKADNTDLMRFDDAPVAFLGLWLSALVLENRQDEADQAKISQNLSQTVTMLSTTTDPSTRRSLLKTQADLSRLLQSAGGMAARLASTNASLLTMRDSMEEIYMGALDGSSTAAVSDKLRETVDNMRISDNIDASIDDMLAGTAAVGGHATQWGSTSIAMTSSDAAKKNAKIMTSSVGVVKR